jgi:hypothetical protein
MRLLKVLTFVFFLSAGNVGAQELLQQVRPTILDDLLAPSSVGSVSIDQPEALRSMIGSRSAGEIEYTPEGQPFIKFQGYRVQVFSGNDQRTSKDAAFKREQEIKEAVPGLPTYVTYTAPFWRLRVGDFSSHEEAYYAQRQLMQLLPAYGKEMYIVKEDVKQFL